MRNVKLLDCTLRDGGRIIDCRYKDVDIKGIASKLTEANIDIIELGFLRDWRTVQYIGNSTFFTDPEQIIPFIEKKTSNTMYVAFVDYGMFDFDRLSKNTGESIEGIRVGFTKTDLKKNKNDVVKCLNIVKEKGYKLFVQGVNSLAYSDKELLELIDIINKVEPYAYGIVDTYGAMYIDDVRRIYNLVDHNLNQDINISFHSHNNFQLSFSFAQEIIKLSQGNRSLIIDSTLNGMGKCAGNLNTELIVDYLNRKLGYNYNFDLILDIIDDYIYTYKMNYQWGYSIPAVMAGIYKSHPNNIIYLTEKFRLSTKDIKYILSMIDSDSRQHYDYENIREIYKKYNHVKVNDTVALTKISHALDKRELLLLFPGKTVTEYIDIIQNYIIQNNPVIIAVNFVPSFVYSNDLYCFFGSEKRYIKNIGNQNEIKCIIVSNIRSKSEEDIIVNYESLINRENEEFDNTGIMLLNLLKKINRLKFTIAGFDGFDATQLNYYDKEMFDESRFKTKYGDINRNLDKMLYEYSNSLERKEDIKFLTPSRFERIFREQ